ncbi:hypothetical protein CMQ_5294 [Grosmannia clavigera kw1407]|uniref:Uncharacterized protein n=1 Tax=Grosmannia clavigera (strain kw1407 / UAMH 11150) TaxID=655863 RepID=F0XB94_GROCL|nr:uncharacterized protein CMQ_5294 [Grosmannia clavigera kw1407]EFX05032.1 hypothetical protein CMQ_5294 [Grosmannia clavigera kw1407]
MLQLFGRLPMELRIEIFSYLFEKKWNGWRADIPRETISYLYRESSLRQVLAHFCHRLLRIYDLDVFYDKAVFLSRKPDMGSMLKEIRFDIDLGERPKTELFYEQPSGTPINIIRMIVKYYNEECSRIPPRRKSPWWMVRATAFYQVWLTCFLRRIPEVEYVSLHLPERGTMPLIAGVNDDIVLPGVVSLSLWPSAEFSLLFDADLDLNMGSAILHMAPNVETLYIFNHAQVSLPTVFTDEGLTAVGITAKLNRIRHIIISLEPELPLVQLSRLFAAMGPNLSSVEIDYRVGLSICHRVKLDISLRDILIILLPWRHTLTSLEIYVGNHSADKRRLTPDDDLLLQFDHLKTLFADEFSIDIHTSRLGYMLPESLEHLKVKGTSLKALAIS